MKRNRATSAVLVAVVFAMLGLTAASAPLYRMFCEATGFGGTTRVADRKSDHTGQRTILVRFNADVNSGLAWRFQPKQREMKVQVGENALAFYEAKNLSREDTVGVATFNVLPEKVGPYVYKLECFCFTEQPLKSAQSVDMPVSFYVDPKIMEDRNLDDVDTITLSYTFFRAAAPRRTSGLDVAPARAN
jgi:cytochrome c oxidase assembly protein subunit 11